MNDSWPKRFRARLHGWAVSREACVKFGLEHGATERLAREVDRVEVLLLVHRDGHVEVESPCQAV